MSALLADTFSELNPQQSIDEGQWTDKEHRRQFLLSFAEKAGFDGRHINNWRSKLHLLPQLRAYGVRACLSLSFVVHDMTSTNPASKGAPLLDKYGSMQKLLAHTFPV